MVSFSADAGEANTGAATASASSSAADLHERRPEFAGRMLSSGSVMSPNLQTGLTMRVTLASGMGQILRKSSHATGCVSIAIHCRFPRPLTKSSAASPLHRSRAGAGANDEMGVQLVAYLAGHAATHLAEQQTDRDITGIGAARRHGGERRVGGFTEDIVAADDAERFWHLDIECREPCHQAL